MIGKWYRKNIASLDAIGNFNCSYNKVRKLLRDLEIFVLYQYFLIKL